MGGDDSHRIFEFFQNDGGSFLLHFPPGFNSPRGSC